MEATWSSDVDDKSRIEDRTMLIVSKSWGKRVFVGSCRYADGSGRGFWFFYVPSVRLLNFTWDW